MRKKYLLGMGGILLSLVLLAGCAEVVQMGTSLGAGMGKISKEDKEAIDRAAAQTAKAVRPMTDEEEYYVGRAVAATILGQYRLYANERLTSYVNEVGQGVALASDRPFTYGGYHFAILDTQEVNALSCPGGIVFITRGMLQKNEERRRAGCRPGPRSGPCEPQTWAGRYSEIPMGGSGICSGFGSSPKIGWSGARAVGFSFPGVSG